MSALLSSGLAFRLFRLPAAAKLGLLIIAAQAALFDGVIPHSAGDVAHAQAAVTARTPEQPQQSQTAQCREETITLDEGYGLRGEQTRVICRR